MKISPRQYFLKGAGIVNQPFPAVLEQYDLLPDIGLRRFLQYF